VRSGRARNRLLYPRHCARPAPSRAQQPSCTCSRCSSSTHAGPGHRCVHHFTARELAVENLPHRCNRLYSAFLQRILKLTVNEIDSVAKVRASPADFNARSKLSSAGRKFLMTSAAANSRKSCCSRTAAYGHCRTPPADEQAVEQRIALRLQLFCFRCRATSGGLAALDCNPDSSSVSAPAVRAPDLRVSGQDARPFFRLL